MIGWYLDIVVLTSILPQWIRMKVATAICFIFSGIIVFSLAMNTEEKKELKQIILTLFPILLILIMGTLFFGSIFGFQTGMENFSFVDRHEVATVIFQGRPSVATMICFILIAIIGLLSSLEKSTKKIFTVLSSIIGIIGTIGVIGYITRIPYLYYEIPPLSNAIAIHTTALFSLLGLAIFLVGKDTINPD
jgi:cytochrome bd-type quinol oxidase subunit 1